MNVEITALAEANLEEIKDDCPPGDKALVAVSPQTLAFRVLPWEKEGLCELALAAHGHPWKALEPLLFRRGTSPVADSSWMRHSRAE